MSNRKMCPFYLNNIAYKNCKCWGAKPESGMVNGYKCPKNTNKKCEIVEPKYVKAKIQGTWKIGVDYGVVINDKSISCLHDGIPILIDRKYLGGKK